jgi:hypothetical protein
MALFGVALITFAILTLRKKAWARFVMFGMVALMFGVPALGMLASSLAPHPDNAQGGSPVTALMPAAMAVYAGWAVFSKRTREYFAQRRQGALTPALVGA